MKKCRSAFLLPDERIVGEIAATFEVKETFGIGYQFANLIATNKRLFSYTNYPLPGLKETVIYQYDDIIRIDVAASLLSFQHDRSFTVKLVNKGNVKQFLETIQLFARNAPGIRNFHQNSAGI